MSRRSAAQRSALLLRPGEQRCSGPGRDALPAAAARESRRRAGHLAQCLPGHPAGCPGRRGCLRRAFGGTATQMACYAKAFSDRPAPPCPCRSPTCSATPARYTTLQHAALANWLQENYGIFPAFAGSGYSVKDSYSLSTEPMTAQQVLVKSVSSEYILKNVSLPDAGCRCISVAPYTGRSNDPLDPDFIAKAGGDGVCTYRAASGSHLALNSRLQNRFASSSQTRGRARTRPGSCSLIP